MLNTFNFDNSVEGKNAAFGVLLYMEKISENQQSQLPQVQQFINKAKIVKLVLGLQFGMTILI